MLIKTATAAVLLTIAAVPVWAVNKCTGADGAVVFQDAPCTGKGETITVRPAAGHAKTAAPTTAAADGAAKTAPPMTEAQRIEQQISQSQQARRRQEMEVRIVPDAFAAITRHRAQCDREIASLKAQKRAANNNLAGATWEGAISGEMTAVATRCDTRNKELRDDANRLLSECKSLGGCK